MSSFEGDATVFSYASEGGISLYAVEPPDGAIAGGSSGTSQGSGATATRIRWWITQNDVGEYEGGITGEDWFRNSSYYGAPVSGPFDAYTDEQIYEIAQRDGNLNEIFTEWNNAHGGIGDTNIDRFVLVLKESNAAGCVISGGVAG